MFDSIYSRALKWFEFIRLQHLSNRNPSEWTKSTKTWALIRKHSFWIMFAVSCTDCASNIPHAIQIKPDVIRLPFTDTAHTAHNATCIFSMRHQNIYRVNTNETMSLYCRYVQFIHSKTTESIIQMSWQWHWHWSICIECKLSV